MNKTIQLPIPYNFTPRAYQLALFNYLDNNKERSRKALLVWPRQIGKDTGCFAYMLKEAARVPGNYFYIFPTAEEARKALWEKIMDNGVPILGLLPEQAIERISNPEMCITLKDTHSTVRILGLDRNPDAIRGVTPMGVVFSEFAYADIAPYRALLPALRKTGCWHILNSTPNGRNHFYELYVGASKSDNWYVSFLQGLYPGRDDYIHIMNQQDFKDMVDEGQMTWDDIEREYGCQFSTGHKGAYYADAMEKALADKRIGSYVYDDMYKVDTFWDLGIGDSTSVWFTQKIGNKIVFIDYFEESGKSIQDYVRMLDSKDYKYGIHHLPHDAANRSIQTGISTEHMFQQMLNSMRVSGRVEVLPKVSIQSGIAAVRARFSRYHFDAEKCGSGIRHVELYHKKWNKKTKVFDNEPQHDEHSHCADALRMEAISQELNQFDATKQELKVKLDFNVFD